MPALSMGFVGVAGTALLDALNMAQEPYRISRAGFNPKDDSSFAVIHNEREYIVAQNKVVRVDEREVKYGVWKERGRKGYR